MSFSRTTSCTILSPGSNHCERKIDCKKVRPCISNHNTITSGHKQIDDYLGDRVGNIVEYTGELLDGDKATGKGYYTDQYGNKLSGHFVNDQLEGACVMIYTNEDRWEGEYKENRPYGKSTHHNARGTIYNEVNKESFAFISGGTKIEDKDDSFYLGGVPHRALDFIN